MGGRGDKFLQSEGRLPTTHHHKTALSFRDMSADTPLAGGATGDSLFLFTDWQLTVIESWRAHGDGGKIYVTTRGSPCRKGVYLRNVLGCFTGSSGVTNHFFNQGFNATMFHMPND